MDKIEELKKLLWILDSKHNVSIPQTKENIDYIADEIVKLFCQPDVSGRSEQLACIHNVERLRLIGGNITCLDCQSTWVKQANCH